MRAFVAIALSITLLACAGCTATTSLNGSSGTVSASAAKSNPDVLVVKALRSYVDQRDSPAALSLIRLAGQKNPDRPELVWLEAQICTQVRSCDPQAIEQRLQALDPDNGAAWLASLARAQQRNDAAAANQILQTIAGSNSFKVYWNALLAKSSLASSRVLTRARADALLPLTNSLNEITGLISPLVTVALRAITDACAPEQTQVTSVASLCLRIADVLIRGDTYISEGVGFGIAERLSNPGTAGAMQVINQIQVSRYQRETAGELINEQVEREKFFGELVQLMLVLPREQDVFITVMRWSGRALTPVSN